MDTALGDRLAGMLDGTPRLAFPDGADDAVIAEWNRSVRLAVRRLLDYSTESVPEVSKLEERRIGDLTLQRLAFGAGPDGHFRASLLYPSVSRPSRAVLVLPGRNGRHEQVIGLEPPDFPDRNVAERLARAGFATLTIDFGLRDAYSDEKRAGRDETSLIAHAMALKGRSLAALLASDAVAALRWLAAEPWVDKSSLGIIGHSLGGYMALYAALAYNQPVPIVLASCAGLYRSMFERDAVAGGAHALPGILQYADLPDLMGALAPAFLQVQHGDRDPFLPMADAGIAIERAAQIYARHNVPERFESSILTMSHGTNSDVAAAFFERAFSVPAMTQRPLVPPVRIEFSAAARRQILERIDRSLVTGELTLGSCGIEFERAAAMWMGTPEAVAVNSGTSAIETALRVVGVRGRRVLLPANTFFATASAALAAGAEVGFVDTEPLGLGIDPDGVRQELERRDDVAAVITVHIGGIISPRIGELIALCAEHGIPLIEDAAHALGSLLDGGKAGGFGRMAAFSLYPTKIITSGEGGLIATRNSADAAVARSLRDHGKRGFLANVHDRIGSNWRMSEVHAAIGLAHMESLAAFVAERRTAARCYDELLGGMRGLTVVREPAGSSSNYYKYMALLDEGVDRNQLKSALRERHGVSLSGEVYDTLCCLQPALEGRFEAKDFPVALGFAARHICLPIFAGMTRAQQDRVAHGLQQELDVQLSAGSIRSPGVKVHASV